MPIIAQSGGTDKYIVGRQYRAPRQLTASKAIETPADLNGVKLRVPETTFYLKVWGGLGVIVPHHADQPHQHLLYLGGQLRLL